MDILLRTSVSVYRATSHHITPCHIWLLPSQAILWDLQSCAFITSYREVHFQCLGAYILQWLTRLSASGIRCLPVSMQLMWLESRLKEVWGWGFRSRGMWPVLLGDRSLMFQMNAAPSSSKNLSDCLSLKALQSYKHVAANSSNNTVPHPSRPEYWTAQLWETKISHILGFHASDLRSLMSSGMSDVFGVLMMF
jgi:hypothetical protein